MTGIWRRDGEAWSLLPPHGFEDEAALHQRIAEAPEMLPLSGQPRLAVVGSEVRLGNGYADVIAVELEGRPVVIEVKLSRNAEARRAVVAQALAYAAYLHGVGAEEFETAISACICRRLTTTRWRMRCVLPIRRVHSTKSRSAMRWPNTCGTAASG